MDILVTEEGPPAAVRAELKHARIVPAPALNENGGGHGRSPAYAE
ncbi:hypothetical protein V5F72_12655 [Xanthobacter flavus]